MFKKWVVIGLAIVLALLGLSACGTGAASTTAITGTGAVSTTPTAHIDKAKFAASWADYKAIESATSVGVSYDQFPTLVQKLVTDISLLPQDLTPAEAMDKEQLATVAQAYADSCTLWGASINGTVPEGIIAIEDNAAPPEQVPGVARMISAYSLATTPRDIPARAGLAAAEWLYIPADSFKTVWTWAEQHGDSLAADLAP